MEQDNTGEVAITATYEQYQSFLSSAVWRDISTEITCWLEVIKNALGSNDEPRELFRMQGRSDVCTNVLELPANLMAILEDRYKKQDVLDDQENFDSYLSQQISDSML